MSNKITDHRIQELERKIKRRDELKEKARAVRVGGRLVVSTGSRSCKSSCCIKSAVTSRNGQRVSIRQT